jgi:hypothetical protein
MPRPAEPSGHGGGPPRGRLPKRLRPGRAVPLDDGGEALNATAVATGLLATGLSLGQLLAWLAIGSPFVGRLAAPLAAPVALLAGSAGTAAAYAVLAAVGRVDEAVVAVPAVCAIALAVRRGGMQVLLRELVRQQRELWGRFLPVAAVVTALLWVAAISPPRDADVLRYHLAHIRRISAEGRWTAIADWHDALPVGWTHNALPAVRLGLPQVAHVVNLLAFLVALGLLGRLVRGMAGPVVAAACAALLALHPLLVKSATTAHLDVYLLLVTSTALALVVDEAAVRARTAAALGFVCWVGTQARYQLIALGIVGTAWVVASAVRARRRGVLGPFGAGTAAALLLAAPFYVMNAVAFGNPVWPILAGWPGGATDYADRVAAAHNARLNGTWSLATVLDGIRGVATEVPVTPLPFVVLCAVVAWPFVGRRGRAPGVVLVGLVALWVATQPALFPRNLLVAVPPAVVVVALAWRRLAVHDRARRVGTAVVACALLGLAGIDLAYSRDSLVYAASADEDRFHRDTWFHDVYDWVNTSTPRDVRFLVIVESAQTYELDRFHRRADPTYAAAVDWEAIRSTDDLARALSQLRVDAIIYHRGDWRPYPGGRRMMAAIDDGRRSGLLRTTRVFETSVTRSRIRGQRSVERVEVLAVAPGRPSAG